MAAQPIAERLRLNSDEPARTQIPVGTLLPIINLMASRIILTQMSHPVTLTASLQLVHMGMSTKVLLIIALICVGYNTLPQMVGNKV